MIYSTDWYGSRTFRMLPITQDCPFNEALYDTTTKVLAIISKEHKEKPQMLPKLNYTGMTTAVYGGTNPEHGSISVGGSYSPEERVIMDTYFEYFIDDLKDIKAFINLFAINTSHPILNILIEDDEE